MITRRILIAGLLLFAVLQVFFTIKRVQNYPFFIYDMYSRPEHPGQLLTQYRIIADRDTLYPTDLPIMAEGMLVHSLEIYDHYSQTGFDYWNPALTDRQSRWGQTFARRSERLLRNQEKAVLRYPAWLERYVEKNLAGGPVTSLKVERIRLNPEGPQILRTKLLIER